MALSPPFIVRIEQRPGSFGETMNEIRSWLDHRRIQPALFNGTAHEIAFNTEDIAM